MIWARSVNPQASRLAGRVSSDKRQLNSLGAARDAKITPATPQRLPLRRRNEQLRQLPPVLLSWRIGKSEVRLIVHGPFTADKAREQNEAAYK